jgi:hypothetical protein
MKLAELFSHGHSGHNVKREYKPETGNKSIVYLGTDAIAKEFSSSISPTVPVRSPTKEKRRVKVKSVGKLNGKQWKKIWAVQGGDHGGETLWLDNPHITGCPTCGY